jgi:tRNA pseudouridine32 synthase / 23S rRNA pseudouridine746 synthase
MNELIVLHVLKESEHELVVYKPAGLASERGDRDADSVLTRVARRREGLTPKLPHRLDRVTRGILLVCLSPAATAFHNERIKARRWEKYYLARVAAPVGATPASFIGEHRAFLTEKNGRAEVVRAGGKPAWLRILAVAPVPERPECWHLVIQLLTGRFHQIRIMCAQLGLPLRGDPLYDPEQRDPADFYLEHVVLKYEDFDTRAASTIFLANAPERGELAPEITSTLANIVARDRGPA